MSIKVFLFRRVRPPFLIAAAAGACLGGPVAAETASSAVPAANEGGALPQIEVNAQRRSIEKRVQTYIATVTPKSYSDSLARWNHGICPSVVGPPSEQADRILAHVSRIATAAGVAIQKTPCQTNLYIVVSSYPEQLLTAWSKRDHLLFGGSSHRVVNQFLATPRPVRVWYNTITTEARDADPDHYGALSALSQSGGGAQETATNAISGSAAANAPTLAALDAAQAASALNFKTVQSFTSVIIIVDPNRAAAVGLDPLSDYIALVGLSQVNFDIDYSGSPSILSIFAPVKGDPEGSRLASLTPWDQKYLKGLYATRQSSRRQRADIEDMMVHDLVK